MNTYKKIETINELIKISVDRYQNRSVVKYINDKGNIVEKSYLELDADIEKISNYLANKFSSGSKIAMLGNISYEWIVTYYAIMNSAMIVIPIDISLSRNAIEDIVNETNACFIIHSEECIDKVKDILSDDKRIFLKGSKTEHSIEKLLKTSLTGISGLEKTNKDTIATIVYTSGTTGKSKGVVLTHGNLCSNVIYSHKILADAPERTGTVPILPLHHMFEITANIQGPLYGGYPICIGRGAKQIFESVKIFRPSILVVVPAVLEMFYKKVCLYVKQQNKYEELLRKTQISHELLEMGIDVRKKLFEDIHELFGGNLSVFISGGANIKQNTITEFTNWGFTVLNGYGITECSPVVCCNRYNDIRIGSVGKIDDQFCDVKIGADGEVMVKGLGVFLKYYNDEVATQEAFEGEYFKTGDIGYKDEGFLYITGRKKNLIILENGENISPEELEEIYAKIPYIGDVLIRTEINQFNKEQLLLETYPDVEFAQKKSKEEMLEYFKKKMEEINKYLPDYKRVYNVKIKETPFEKTALEKIKR